LFQQQGPDQAGDGLVVGEDTHDIRAALDLAVQALDRVCAVQLGSMLVGEGHVGQHIVFGLIHDGRQLRHLWPDLVGDRAPLGAGGFGRVLSEGRGDEGRDDPAPALPGMGKGVALEVDAGAVEKGAIC
jgi:hypothetical protein